MRHRAAWRSTLLQAFKVAVGAAAAILLANALGLSSGMTAGIIAILSIQGTKQDTWRLAGERLLAFAVAVMLAWCSFQALGYTLLGFTLYLLLFTVVCVCMRWSHALAMVSVLITHFVAAGSMTPTLLGNETLLLLIGALCGMVVNLHLRPEERRMRLLCATMDAQMVAALQSLADAAEQDAPFQTLEQTLREADALAQQNRANRLWGGSGEEVAYVVLRRSQYRVLLQMRQAMRASDPALPQYRMVGDFIQQVAREYHRDNDVASLLAQQAQVLAAMQAQPLPVSRAEFEHRAVLYQVLLRMEDFLLLKRDYYVRYRRVENN